MLPRCRFFVFTHRAGISALDVSVWMSMGMKYAVYYEYELENGERRSHVIVYQKVNIKTELFEDRYGLQRGEACGKCPRGIYDTLRYFGTQSGVVVVGDMSVRHRKYLRGSKLCRSAERRWLRAALLMDEDVGEISKKEVMALSLVDLREKVVGLSK